MEYKSTQRRFSNIASLDEEYADSSNNIRDLCPKYYPQLSCIDVSVCTDKDTFLDDKTWAVVTYLKIPWITYKYNATTTKCRSEHSLMSASGNKTNQPWFSNIALLDK